MSGNNEKAVHVHSLDLDHYLQDEIYASVDQILNPIALGATSLKHTTVT